MIEAIYVFFFWILVLEVLVFLFLNIPTPRGWKGKVIKFLTSSNHLKTFMKIHLGCCFLAAIFYYDCSTTESMFLHEKNNLKDQGHGHMGSQLRIGWLSYSILKVQRNKYITFMLIYASLCLNIYIQLLRYTYNKRDQFEKKELMEKEEKVEKQAAKETPVPSETKKDK